LSLSLPVSLHNHFQYSWTRFTRTY